MPPFDRDRVAVLTWTIRTLSTCGLRRQTSISLQRAASELSAARAAGMPVIYVVIHLGPRFPDVPAWGVFNMVRHSAMLQEGTECAAIHDADTTTPVSHSWHEIVFTLF